MADPTIIEGVEANQWHTTFAEKQAVSALFKEATVPESFADLSPSKVSESDGTVKVMFYCDKESDKDDYSYIRLTGEFDSTSETLKTARLDTGHIAGPLAGRGVRWQYQDGEITRREWIS